MALGGDDMEIKHRHILCGSIKELMFFCEQTGHVPAWHRPIFNEEDVKRIPVGATVILYGSYADSAAYPLIQQAWEEDLIHTWVITPNEITS